MKTTEQCQWSRPDDFIDNFEQVSDLVLVFLLLALSMDLFAGIDEYSTV